MFSERKFPSIFFGICLSRLIHITMVNSESYAAFMLEVLMILGVGHPSLLMINAILDATLWDSSLLVAFLLKFGGNVVIGLLFIPCLDHVRLSFFSFSPFQLFWFEIKLFHSECYLIGFDLWEHLLSLRSFVKILFRTDLHVLKPLFTLDRCIPFRYRSSDETDVNSEKVVEVLMINSTSGPGLLFPKVRSCFWFQHVLSVGFTYLLLLSCCCPFCCRIQLHLLVPLNRLLLRGINI